MNGNVSSLAVKGATATPGPAAESSGLGGRFGRKARQFLPHPVDEQAHPHSATSSDPRHGVDVSHRGGPPGFVRVDHPGQLSVPDFSGNFYFNTLGNLLLEPRACLLFIDFERGDLLYVLAQAQLLTDAAALSGFAGAQRVLRLRLSQVLHLQGAWPWPWRWGPPQASPLARGLGPWQG